MCEISMPIVRVGRVLAFDQENRAQFKFDKEKATAFADYLRKDSTEPLDDLYQDIKSYVERTAQFGTTQVFPTGKWKNQQPKIFRNALKVVQFDDFEICTNDITFTVGLSATVCEGNKSSKVWCRVSSNQTSLNSEQASEVIDDLAEIANEVSAKLANFYRAALSSFLESQETQGSFVLKDKHVYQIEAGGYPIEKLFDSVRALGETKSLFKAHERGNWHPIKDLLELAFTRDPSTFGFLKDLQNLDAERVSEGDIRSISEQFNSDGLGLSWEITMGQHGVFVGEEKSQDPFTSVVRTRMIGICGTHSSPPKNQDGHRMARDAAWVVSGQVAPSLGAYH